MAQSSIGNATAVICSPAKLSRSTTHTSPVAGILPHRFAVEIRVDKDNQEGTSRASCVSAAPNYGARNFSAPPSRLRLAADVRSVGLLITVRYFSVVAGSVAGARVSDLPTVTPCQLPRRAGTPCAFSVAAIALMLSPCPCSARTRSSTTCSCGSGTRAPASARHPYGGPPPAVLIPPPNFGVSWVATFC